MPHVITDLCLRDGGCTTVCPVDCITPGNPLDEWPTYYIDPDSCIDCDACVSECPNQAIFTDEDMPAAFKAKGGEFLTQVNGSEVFDGTDRAGKKVHLKGRSLKAGEVIDFTKAIATNAEFYKSGPGYSAKE